jgi:hypothetical protein
MTWYDEFNSVFFTGVATMAFTALALLVKYGFASKCDNVNLCFGLIQIHRQVELEHDEPTDDEEAKHDIDDEVETKKDP